MFLQRPEKQAFCCPLLSAVPLRKLTNIVSAARSTSGYKFKDHMRSFQQNSRHQNTVRRDPKTLTDVYGMGNLSKDVFQRRVSTGNDAFSHLTCLNATKIGLLSVLSLIKKICRTFG